MIEHFVGRVKAAIGTEVGNRIYAEVVPVQATFPCVMFRRVYSDPYQTKDGANRGLTRMRLWIYAKNTGETSGYKAVADIGETLRAYLNGLVVGSYEYRCDDQRNGYEEEIESYFEIIDIHVQHDIPAPSVGAENLYSWGNDFIGTLITEE